MERRNEQFCGYPVYTRSQEAPALKKDIDGLKSSLPFPPHLTVLLQMQRWGDRE